MFYAQKNQVGIDTPAPKALFHVDGGKDNPKNPATALTPSQVANDVVVTTSGNVGIANITPATKLDIYNGTTNGAIKIVDGTQGKNKVLISDKDGVGTWRMPNSFKSVVIGTIGAGWITSDGTSTQMWYKSVKNSTYKVVLTKGKWIVNAGLTIQSTQNNGSRFWFHAYLSDKDPATVPAPMTFYNAVEGPTKFEHLGPAGNNTSYAGLVHANQNTHASTGDGANFISGSSLINVKEDTTLYLYFDNSNRQNANVGDHVGSWKFNTAALENYFYAIPVE